MMDGRTNVITKTLYTVPVFGHYFASKRFNTVGHSRCRLYQPLRRLIAEYILFTMASNVNYSDIVTKKIDNAHFIEFEGFFEINIEFIDSFRSNIYTTHIQISHRTERTCKDTFRSEYDG